MKPDVREVAAVERDFSVTAVIRLPATRGSAEHRAAVEERGRKKPCAMFYSQRSDRESAPQVSLFC